MCDVLVVVPQPKEYEAVHGVLALTASPPQPGGPAGTFRVDSPGAPAGSGCSLTVAVRYLDSMYNLPSLSRTQRLLDGLRPRYAFLVGTACGNPSKVAALDVVLSVPCIAYIGQGRLVDGTPKPPRHVTYPLGRDMENALRDFYVYRTERNRSWRARSRWVMARLAETGLDIGPSHAFNGEVKHGLIASDDYVLEWSDRDRARAHWRLNRDDVHAYDMESAGFAYACVSHGDGLQWAVVRGVSDHGIRGQRKRHLEAAAAAATCLESFLRFLVRPADALPGSTFDPKTYDWHLLFQLLEDEQSRFGIVFKGTFIKQVLRGWPMDVSALGYALSSGAVSEYEVPAHWQRPSETAIRLDRDRDRWLDYLQRSSVASSGTE